MAHEAQMAQMALTALSARSGRRRFCRSTDGLGRGGAGRVRRDVVGRAEAAPETPGDGDGGRFERQLEVRPMSNGSRRTLTARL